MSVGKLAIPFIVISMLLCSCSKDAVTVDESVEFMPGITLKDNRITGTYKGVQINASFYGKNADKVNLYNARPADFKYADHGFNEGVLTYKEPSDIEGNYDKADNCTDKNGNVYEVLAYNYSDERQDGFYCAEPRLDSHIVTPFRPEYIPDEINFTDVVTNMSHSRPDGIPDTDDLPTDFDYWEVLTFPDSSYYAYRSQSIDGIPILNGYSPEVIKWSEQYKGMGIEEGRIEYKKTSDYWYVFDARDFVSIDKEAIDSCKVKDIDDCFEAGVKGIKSETYLYGKDPVIYDVTFGYIMLKEYDPQKSPPVWVNEPDPEPDDMVYVTVPVWRFKAYYPTTNLIYSAYVNAATGESVW